MNAFSRIAIALVIPLVAGSSPVDAQVRAAVGGGGGFETFTFSEPSTTGIRSLSLLAVPFAARVPLGSRLSLDAAGAWARGVLERADGSEATLSGLTDTRLVLAAQVVPGQLILSGVLVMPTGEKMLDEAEAEVAGAIAADLLPFRLSNWSTGGGIGASAAWARSFGAVGIGMSAAYVLGQEFDLLEQSAEEFAYRPGDQLMLRGVIDATVGPAGKLSLQLTWQRANEDQLNGSNLFRSGSRVQALTSWAFAFGRGGSGMAYGGILHRSKGVFLLEAGADAPSQDLWLAGTSFRVPIGGAVLHPGGDLRLLRRSDGTDQGYTATVGTGLELTGGAVTFVPSIKARFGRVLAREDIETGFTGFDAAMIIRFGGR